MQENETHIVGTERVYELSVLFVPELQDSALSQAVADLKSHLASLEANIITEGKPTHIKLAYQVEKHINNKIKKVNFANFYWVKFEIDSAKINEIKKFVDSKMNELVMRHLIIKTVKENTFLTEIAEAKLLDIKNDELIAEVIASDLTAEVAAEKVDEGNTITDLGGDKPLESANETKE